MMILELNAYKIEAYEPYSLALAIVHAVVSGMVCFAFLLLDPDNVKWEVAIGACFTLIIAGMLGNILGVRIYFSIITNAVGFSALFASMKFFRDRGQIEIDCYGDRANAAEFSSSTLFAEMKGSEEISEKSEKDTDIE